MVLLPLMSISSLSVRLRNLAGVTFRRDFIRSRSYTHALPPTILTKIFGSNKGKTFGKEATAGSNSLFASPCLREELFCKTSEPVRDCCHKVAIVGAGMVGISVASSLLFQRITSQIAMVDPFPKKLEGDGLDFLHGSIFMRDPKIEFDTDFCITANSKVVVICVGARPTKGGTRLDVVHKNTEIIKEIIPILVNYSPNAVFVVVSNPVDIMSWITWKISGLPIHQVIGSGTYIDSARFRFMIGDRLGIAPSSVQAYIIGEHGDSMVPLWSGVSIAGVQFRDVIPNIGLETDDEKWHELSKEVVTLGAVVRCLKGYTNIAIGLSASDIVASILYNTQNVIPVSTQVQGHHDIDHDMFLSLPCVIGENGITHVIRMHITEYEKKLLHSSANGVFNVQKKIKVNLKKS